MIEVLKKALEALELCNGAETVDGVVIYTDQEIAAIKEAIAELESQEPVAVKRMKEWIEFLKRLSDNGQYMNITCVLSAGICWELAIELEQFINTTPPQRTEQEPLANELAQLKEEIALLKYKLWDCEEKSKPMQGQ